MSNKLGTHVKMTGKSKHAGQTGIVVRDYDDHLIIKVDDETYDRSFKSSIGEGKYLQVDAGCAVQIKENK